MQNAGSQDRAAAPFARRPKACYFVGVALVLYLGAAVGIILIAHLNRVQWVASSQQLRNHILCAAFGMLGSSTAAIRKYYRSLISETMALADGTIARSVLWDFAWVYYYLTRPLLGAVLGALSFTLSFIGFHVLAKPAEIAISDEGRYLLFALAFISGYSVSHALDRLNSVAKELLRTETKQQER